MMKSSFSIVCTSVAVGLGLVVLGTLTNVAFIKELGVFPMLFALFIYPTLSHNQRSEVNSHPFVVDNSNGNKSVSTHSQHEAVTTLG